MAKFAASFFYFLVFVLPISITAIAMGSVHMNRCKVESTLPGPPVAPPPGTPPSIIYTPDAFPAPIGNARNQLNVWLIVHGAVYLFWGLLLLFATGILDSKSSAGLATIIFLLYLTAWIIYGGIVIFGTGGKTCKNTLVSGGKNVYRTALGIWVLMLIQWIPHLLSLSFFF